MNNTTPLFTAGLISRPKDTAPVKYCTYEAVNFLKTHINTIIDGMLKYDGTITDGDVEAYALLTTNVNWLSYKHTAYFKNKHRAAITSAIESKIRRYIQILMQEYSFRTFFTGPYAARLQNYVCFGLSESIIAKMVNGFHLPTASSQAMLLTQIEMEMMDTIENIEAASGGDPKVYQLVDQLEVLTATKAFAELTDCMEAFTHYPTSIRATTDRTRSNLDYAIGIIRLLFKSNQPNATKLTTIPQPPHTKKWYSVATRVDSYGAAVLAVDMIAASGGRRQIMHLAETDVDLAIFTAGVSVIQSLGAEQEYRKSIKRSD